MSHSVEATRLPNLWYGALRRKTGMTTRKVNKAIQVALVEDDPGVRANLAAMINIFGRDTPVELKFTEVEREE